MHLKSLRTIAILNTFEISDDTYTHGLGFDKKTLSVTIEKEGLFARLHDCYSPDPSLYSQGYEFKLDKIVNTEPVAEKELFARMSEGSLGHVSVYEETTKKPTM